MRHVLVLMATGSLTILLDSVINEHRTAGAVSYVMLCAAITGLYYLAGNSKEEPCTHDEDEDSTNSTTSSDDGPRSNDSSDEPSRSTVTG